MAKLGMVTVANTKMRVMPASRMLSAISFGVFCRTAPSTSAIMRSRKVEPWAAVIFTFTQSEITRVPPVTAERSPPLSRMTGADSPVIADSSTEAMPSMTSPSLGMVSPASTNTRSPCLSAAAGTCSHWRACALVRRLALVSVRMRRSVSACALPRPSATASAKLANSTVNHSQAVICPEKSGLVPMMALPPTKRSRRKKMVQSTETISTTNMTGFLTSVRGSSLRKEARIAGTMSALSNSDKGATCRLNSPVLGEGAVGDRFVIAACPSAGFSCSRRRIERAGVQRDLLDHRAERYGREVGEPADDHDDADEQADEERALCRERPGRGRQQLLLRQRARDGQQRYDEDEAAHEHREAERRVVEQRVGGDAGERAAVVPGRRRVGVEHHAEAVRPSIGDARQSGRHDGGERGPAEHRERQGGH